MNWWIHWTYASQFFGSYRKWSCVNLACVPTKLHCLDHVQLRIPVWLLSFCFGYVQDIKLWWGKKNRKMQRSQLSQQNKIFVKAFWIELGLQSTTFYLHCDMSSRWIKETIVQSGPCEDGLQLAHYTKS